MDRTVQKYMNSENELIYGQGYVIEDGEDIALITYNPYMLRECIKASKLLINKNINTKVINLPWLNYLDKKWFNDVTAGIDHIFTVEDHMVFTGMGSYVNTQISGKSIINLGVSEIPVNGSNLDALNYHNLSADKLVESINLKLFNEKL